MVEESSSEKEEDADSDDESTEYDPEEAQHVKNLSKGIISSKCHTPVLGNRTEASIRVSRMFKSHVRPTIW